MEIFNFNRKVYPYISILGLFPAAIVLFLPILSGRTEWIGIIVGICLGLVLVGYRLLKQANRLYAPIQSGQSNNRLNETITYSFELYRPFKFFEKAVAAFIFLLTILILIDYTLVGPWMVFVGFVFTYFPLLLWSQLSKGIGITKIATADGNLFTITDFRLLFRRSASIIVPFECKIKFKHNTQAAYGNMFNRQFHSVLVSNTRLDMVRIAISPSEVGGIYLMGRVHALFQDYKFSFDRFPKNKHDMFFPKIQSELLNFPITHERDGLISLSELDQSISRVFKPESPIPIRKLTLKALKYVIFALLSMFAVWSTYYVIFIIVPDISPFIFLGSMILYTTFTIILIYRILLIISAIHGKISYIMTNGILEINYKFKMLPALSLKIPLVLEPKLFIDTGGLYLILVSGDDIYFKLPIGKLNETNQQ